MFHLACYVQATHIRAGEIIATRITTFTYQFTLTIYANSLSPADNPTAVLDFGDNTNSGNVNRASKTYIGNDTYKNVYITTHTFSGAGNYIVSYFEVFRNGSIVNLGSPLSTPFYVETLIVISGQTGNNTPVITQTPPIDKATVGQIFTHNAGAYDADGDSISYKLVVPKANVGTNAFGYYTPDYSHSFTLNPITGDLVWDAPLYPLVYNVAFIIEEWKKGVTGVWSRVGYITRDMQIDVLNSSNHPPVLHLPNDTCISAGQNLNKPIKATDPDGNKIAITAYPSIPPFPVSYFSMTPNPQNTPAQGTFNWTPTCNDIREQPYEFVFKAEDRPTHDTLADERAWQVKVKGPQPQNLTAVSSGKNMVLNWSGYICPNADSMYIYRKDCHTITNGDPCTEGIEGYPGYVKISAVSIGVTGFVDDNNGKGLRRGTEYCYMIQAKFPLPKLGESYVSSQVCEGLVMDAPLISSVTVNNTSASSGSITVSWIPPVNPPFAAPYTYNLYRTTGIDSNHYSLVASNVSSPYIDNNLDTEKDGYTYKVELAGGAMSDPSSSALLKIKVASSALKLSWDQVAPNNNDSIDVYRSINGSSYNFLTRLYGDPKAYKDVGLKNCDTVCYYLKIYSSFCDINIISPEYTSLSQLTCGVPIDSFPPNVPQLSVTGCGTNISIFQNILNWTNVTDPVCSNIKGYNIYFAGHDDAEDTLFYYASTDNNTFQYIDIDSISTAGCYTVSAVNTYDVESAQSNKVCVDDCIYYELPNLITPNGDSLNDFFHAFPIPRGVELVRFAVYNGWGKLVFSISDNINIHWNGMSNDGTYLSDGVYFFSAEIKYFRRVHRSDELKTIKGWVQIFNQTNGSSNGSSK